MRSTPRARALPAPKTEDVPILGDAASERAITFEADVDGSRVRITAKDEVVIQCGKASITMRRNGRIVIRGTHVETASTGTNRIKGSQVRVN
jgi:uncharacterized protein (DUF2345 family)